MKNGLERQRAGATPTNQRTGGSSDWDAAVASCSHTRMRGSPVYGDVGVLQPRHICLARSPLLSQTTHAAPPKAVPPRQLAAAPPSRAAAKSSTSPAHVASAVAVGSKWLSASSRRTAGRRPRLKNENRSRDDDTRKFRLHDFRCRRGASTEYRYEYSRILRYYPVIQLYR